ncbi:MAG: glucose-6-phosphate dehydrogenase [Aestuariivita sp.]|nr:glucose-6-phosphate dehydrogenase [Aestuariivita sp.]
MVSRVIPVDSFDIVIFGATGDLARRKILPALFHRYAVGQMPDEARILGVARREINQQAFKTLVRDNLIEFTQLAVKEPKLLKSFLEKLTYFRVDVHGEDGWSDVSGALRSNVKRVFCFSVSPSFFGLIASKLHATGLANPDCRILIEKPFGHNLIAAKSLNNELLNLFSEHQIYRIDHYLGKETVQNLMALRFSNALWEPLWNSTHIDHVQITVAETIGVSGRGDYYDRSGAMRDMVQNHLMQLLCLIAMEPPARFEPNSVRDEKVKVIQSLEPVLPTDIVRGQYRDKTGNETYRNHVNNPDSNTESFVAMKVNIGNWRWASTPFYLRTGKKLKSQSSEVAIIFRDPPHMIFPISEERKSNALIIRLQPNEGIKLHNMIKEPGPGGFRLTDVSLDMTFANTLGTGGNSQDAYERLIMDVIRGDQTLFMRGDEVEAAWAWVDPIIAEWEQTDVLPAFYQNGSSGPDQATSLLHRDGREWRDIC